MVEFYRNPTSGFELCFGGMVLIMTIYALIPLGLMISVRPRRARTKFRRAICGGAITKNSVKRTVSGREFFFCYEHCAAAFMRAGGER